MSYEELVNAISEKTEVSTTEIRAVLNALPEFLRGMGEGEKVRTPIGVFRMVLRKARQVQDLNGEGQVFVPSELVCKLKPSVRLKRFPKA